MRPSAHLVVRLDLASDLANVLQRLRPCLLRRGEGVVRRAVLAVAALTPHRVARLAHPVRCLGALHVSCCDASGGNGLSDSVRVDTVERASLHEAVVGGDGEVEVGAQRGGVVITLV